MKYEELKEMCRKTWSEKTNNLCFDVTKINNEGEYRVLNGSKNTYIESVCETEAI